MPKTTHIFPFRLLMSESFKIPGPFAKIIRDADKKLTRQIALPVIIFSGIALGLMIVYRVLNKPIIVHQ